MKASTTKTGWPILVLILFAALSGCATKRIVSQWTNPDYTSEARTFHRIMVVGSTDQDSIRRNFEDRMVAALTSNGVQALPSYRTLLEPSKDVKDLDAQVRAAVQKANADGVLVTRLLRVEQRAAVEPGYYEPYLGFGYHHWYPGFYGGFYSPPRYYSYPIYYSETTLYDAGKNDVVWTGTIRTIDPENADEAIADYVQTVVAALRDQHLLAVGSSGRL